MQVIDINVDLGEGGSEDAALMRLASSVNVACGGHAGNDFTMQQAVKQAMAAGVALGAHPGYEDKPGFGRRHISMTAEAITEMVYRQITALQTHAVNAGVELHHVKPHGALYHAAHSDLLVAEAVVRGMGNKLKLYAMPGSTLAIAGEAAGMMVLGEGFADRRYLTDGSLMPRSEKGVLIEEVEEAVAQSWQLLRSGTVRTLCVHGDGKMAVNLLAKIRKSFEAAGVRITTND